MNELFASTAFFGMFLTLGLYQLARFINRRVGREVCNPQAEGGSLIDECRVICAQFAHQAGGGVPPLASRGARKAGALG